MCLKWSVSLSWTKNVSPGTNPDLKKKKNHDNCQYDLKCFSNMVFKLTLTSKEMIIQLYVKRKVDMSP